MRTPDETAHDSPADPPPLAGVMPKYVPPTRVRWWLVGVLAVLAAFAFGIGKLIDLLPGFGNPFRTEVVDRSQPALLESLEDLSDYQAASGHFQQIVDIEEDTRFLPSFVSGERTLFVAVGSVDAEVSFGGLDADAVVVSDDRRSVTVTLPPAHLSEAVIDPEDSYVADRERGVLDRLGSVLSDSPTSERELYLLAEDKLEAAAAESDLLARAEDNTRGMLEKLFGSLGFADVTIRFESPPET